MAFLECKSVTKEYATTTALKNICFSVKNGEMVAIIGPSGAGKSTLLRCINRMIKPTTGEVIFDGINFNRLNSAELRQQRRKIGMVFQHYNLVNRLSVVENVLHGRLGYKSTLEGILGKYNESEKEDAFKILARLGMEEQAYKR